MNSDTEFLTKVNKLCDLFDEVEEMINSNGERQQKTDFMLSDLEHSLENETLTDTEIIGIGRKIQELRKDRRCLKNEFELIKKFIELKNRLLETNNRAIFKSTMNTTMKNLNQPYKNRVFTEEEMTEIKKSQEKPVTIKIETKVDTKKIAELVEKKLTQREIAKKLGCSQSTVNYYIKKIKKEGIENENND